MVFLPPLFHIPVFLILNPNYQTCQINIYIKTEYLFKKGNKIARGFLHAVTVGGGWFVFKTP